MYNVYISFSYQHLVQGRHLGLVEDASDNLTFMVEIIRDRKKSRLKWSVAQELYLIAAHLPEFVYNITLMIYLSLVVPKVAVMCSLINNKGLELEVIV